MKVLLKILIVAMCIGIVVYYTNVEPSKTEILEGPTAITIPVTDATSKRATMHSLPRPTEGISIFIGQSSKNILDNYGKPMRIDPSEFGYDWWVYERDVSVFMVGVKNGLVTQIYTNDIKMNTAPYKMGQSLNDIYRMTIFEQEVTVERDENIYLFAMNDQDLKNRILVKYDDVYVQLYIDEETNALYGIRFLDGETLILHKSYEMQFIGELIEASTPSSFEQLEINRANSRQLTQLTNAFRKSFDLSPLTPLSDLATIATKRSEQRLFTQFESQALELEAELDVEAQLDDLQLHYAQVGENVATNYNDSIETMHAWINSKEHRAFLLSEDFTQIGSGVYLNYFTQLYLK